MEDVVINKIKEEMENSGEEDVEKQCRICYDGEDERGNRLFSPCLCKGSVKYIHQECLNHWRTTCPGEKSFYECDLCHYQYQFIRLRWARYLQYKQLPLLITTFLMMAIIFMGSCANKPNIYTNYVTEGYYWIADILFGFSPTLHSIILFSTLASAMINWLLLLLFFLYEKLFRSVFTHLPSLMEDTKLKFPEYVLTVNFGPLVSGAFNAAPSITPIFTVYLVLYLFSLPFIFCYIISDMIKVSLYRTELRILEVVRSHED